MSSHARGYDTRLKFHTHNADVWDSVERKRLAARSRRVRYLIGNWLGTNLYLEWQLFRGDGKWPRTKAMTKAQARTENKKFRQKFLSSDDENARLWEWRDDNKEKNKKIWSEALARCINHFHDKKSSVKIAREENEKNFPGGDNG